MTETVKRRMYVSPQRQAKAEATRRRILDAAATLFAEAGYGRTSAASLARAAEVSEASVFAVFGSKANLLVEVILDQVTRHSDFPLRTQPGWQAFAGAADKRPAITAFAAVACRAHERSWRLLTVAAAAAEGDEELATAMMGGAAKRHQDCGWLVREVAPATCTPAAPSGTAANHGPAFFPVVPPPFSPGSGKSGAPFSRIRCACFTPRSAAAPDFAGFAPDEPEERYPSRRSHRTPR